MPKGNIIGEEVRAALSSIEWDGEYGRLTCGQLDRKTYTNVNDVLETFGGKWNKKLKCHVFAEAAQMVVEAAIETGVYVSATDVKQFYGEFETPDAIADRVVELGGISSGALLEPSAGSGQLLKAYKRRHGQLPTECVAVEIQEKRRAELLALGVSVTIDDFLKVKLNPRFSLALMNPPFARQADIDHVMHAFSMLEETGRLVAIMSPGWTFSDNAKSVAFRQLVEQHGTFEEISEGAFKESGTGIRTVLVTLRK
jgi:type I restriction-modification system DNA methylase subunit